MATRLQRFSRLFPPNTFTSLIFKETCGPSSLEKIFVHSHLAGKCSNLCAASYDLLIVDEA